MEAGEIRIVEFVVDLVGLLFLGDRVVAGPDGGEVGSRSAVFRKSELFLFGQSVCDVADRGHAPLRTHIQHKEKRLILCKVARNQRSPLKVQ